MNARSALILSLALGSGAVLLAQDAGVNATIPMKVSDQGRPLQQIPGNVLRLLDRGDAAAGLKAAPLTEAQNTLQVGGATAGSTANTGLGFGTAPAGAFVGNFFQPALDFPTSYYPFAVTGLFTYHIPPSTSRVLAAAAATAPFTSAGSGFADYLGGALSAGSPGPAGVIGAPGIFGGTATGVQVATGQGAVCGLLVLGSGITGWGNGLGGVTPGTGAQSVYLFGDTGTFGSSFLIPGGLTSVDWIAGCYISGATVPVELQAFSVD